MLLILADNVFGKENLNGHVISLESIWNHLINFVQEIFLKCWYRSYHRSYSNLNDIGSVETKENKYQVKGECCKSLR